MPNILQFDAKGLWPGLGCDKLAVRLRKQGLIRMHTESLYPVPEAFRYCPSFADLSVKSSESTAAGTWQTWLGLLTQQCLP